MKTIHEMVKTFGGGDYEAILNAIKATGLRGRLVRGERVWSDDEAARIAAAVKPAAYTVRVNNANRPERFATRAEAAEFAQEDLALAPDAAWKVVTVRE